MENVLILEPSLHILEKIQPGSALPDIKYRSNCAVLFMCQICLLLVYASKYIFSETTTVKPKSETCDTFAKVF